MIALALIAIGLVFFVEGLVYVLAPSFVEELLDMLRSLSLEQRRIMGGMAAVAGASLVWAGHALTAGGAF